MEGQNPNNFGVTLGIAMLCLWYFFNSKSVKHFNKIIIFFIGIAAIAGLGGYQLKWVIEAVKHKKATKNKG